MKTDQEIDKALAEEFAGYLKSISKEIVQPIRDETNKQKQEIDRLTASIDQAGARIGTLLDSHRDQLSVEGQSLLASLDNICRQMSGIVEGVSAANEVTRDRLLKEAAAISSTVATSAAEIGASAAGMREALSQSLSQFHAQSEPWISQAGKSLVVTMDSRIRSAEARLVATVEEGMEVKLRKIDGPLSQVRRLQYWMIAVCLLQVATIAAIWLLI